ncbi:dipeptidase PepV [Brevibacillus daliensis]|uniref:dipeptidase PepV n=1 Tax=Brevibacillus daliensis TaxID=2892995 RepID=UPI001E508083|nr:dipeptidase PepV [Brevibacillus daliensis]
MSVINWKEEVEKHKEELLQETQQFLRINSVYDPETIQSGAPFGEGIRQALEFALHQCEKLGMTTKNLDGYAGHGEFGQGEELVGVLSHVDVVPPGDGWNVPPFAAEIIEGKIIARGALDDKGPAMAAIFAAKIVKESGLPLGKRVRLIFGTDEESGWQCVQHYFEHEEMPTMGFTPDADFPIIFAEKGLTVVALTQTPDGFNTRQDARLAASKQVGKVAFLRSFHSGLRVNMVPDLARAELVCAPEQAESIDEAFRNFLIDGGNRGDVVKTENGLVLTMQGISVHGMDPAKGLNAGTHLAHFLSGYSLDERGAAFVAFLEKYLYEQHDGKALTIAQTNLEMGDLTVNPGILTYQADGIAEIYLNIRYPHSAEFEFWEPRVRGIAIAHGYEMEMQKHQRPHRVDPNHQLVTTLQRVYTEQTGEEATLVAIGGGTYGRALDVGVAFGPLFPGREDTAHQRDEYLLLEDLLRATTLYAQAIYELAKE